MYVTNKPHGARKLVEFCRGTSEARVYYLMDHKCALKLQKHEGDEYINYNPEWFKQFGHIHLKHKDMAQNRERG